jgi:hypothetical protein
LFTTEAWTASGLVTWFTFFVIDLATRAVEIVGSTPNPREDYMRQVARQLADEVDGVLATNRFLRRLRFRSHDAATIAA